MYLTVDKGPMWGGKTTRLLLLYEQYRSMKIPCLIIKHTRDNRTPIDVLATHGGKNIPCISMEHLMRIDMDGLAKGTIILVDEAQWFDDLYEWVRINFHRDIKVHVAGLNGDKNQEPFGQVNMLSSMCSEEHTHYALCHICGDRAPFSLCRYKDLPRDSPGNGNLYYTVCYRHLM